jgi:hypothetical protein
VAGRVSDVASVGWGALASTVCSASGEVEETSAISLADLATDPLTLPSFAVRCERFRALGRFFSFRRPISL